ncbi:MAG: DUF1415 domain-containing protein [Saprospiraceae bacterium]|nr:DUF1415 domain-containing protein [Saprospiraceae bacterium]
MGRKIVIGLNLCPFAKPVFIKNQIKFVISEAKNPTELTQHFLQELNFLTGIEGDDTETTILVHPFVLQDFGHYLDYLDYANDLIYQAGLEGTFQIASFHPDYQFEGTEPTDIENYTNRSPFPMLHILREDTLEKAIKTYPDVEDIPANNIEKLKELGLETLKKLM